MKKLPLVIVLLLLVACAPSRTNVPFEVTSVPTDAPVDINGVYSGNTPTTVTLSTTKRWVGVYGAPGGWEYGDETYAVTVCPPLRSVEKLHCHTKNIKPSMTLEGGR